MRPPGEQGLDSRHVLRSVLLSRVMVFKPLQTLSTPPTPTPHPTLSPSTTQPKPNPHSHPHQHQHHHRLPGRLRAPSHTNVVHAVRMAVCTECHPFNLSLPMWARTAGAYSGGRPSILTVGALRGGRWVAMGIEAMCWTTPGVLTISCIMYVSCIMYHVCIVYEDCGSDGRSARGCTLMVPYQTSYQINTVRTPSFRKPRLSSFLGGTPL